MTPPEIKKLAVKNPECWCSMGGVNGIVASQIEATVEIDQNVILKGQILDEINRVNEAVGIAVINACAECTRGHKGTRRINIHNGGGEVNTNLIDECREYTPGYYSGQDAAVKAVIG